MAGNNSASGENIFANAAKRKKESSRKQKELTLGERTYIIKLWKSDSCIDRMPTVGNLLVVPTGAIDEFADNNGLLDYTGILFNNLQRLNDTDFKLSGWIEYMLDEVYLKGEDSPVDPMEEFDPLELLTVLEAVLEANFMIPLCVRMLRMTDSIATTNQVLQGITPEQHSTKPSIEQ